MFRINIWVMSRNASVFHWIACIDGNRRSDRLDLERILSAEHGLLDCFIVMMRLSSAFPCSTEWRLADLDAFEHLTESHADVWTLELCCDNAERPWTSIGSMQYLSNKSRRNAVFADKHIARAADENETS